MGAFALMVEGLADIMQQSRALRKRHIESQLAGHQACQMGDLDGMLEYILSV